MGFLDTILKKLLLTAGWAMIPVLELRGAIPIGVAQGLEPWTACTAAVVGNMLPIPFLILLTRRVFDWLRATPLLGPRIVQLEHRAHLKGRLVRKYRLLGLTLFVAIPLPGTGAWTGALVSALLGLRMKFALPAIAEGVAAAGVIVLLVCQGVVHIAGL